MRRIATILAVSAFLIVATGATTTLHFAQDAHHSDASSDCKTCQFIKAVSVAIVAMALVAAYTLVDSRPLVLTGLTLPVRRLGHGAPAGPRAPPLR